MKIEVDTHTHTLASGHAYSTISENAKEAKDRGLKLLCNTDHASSMPGAPHFWYFNNQKVLPRFLHEVGIIRGVEANLLNIKGEIDLHPTTYDFVDWVIASLHEPVFPPENEKVHTEALINVIKSNKVDVLGHLGNPNYPFDIEAVLQCAKEYNVAIEVNNTSLTGRSRNGSAANCDQIVKIGNQIGVYFSTGSDAHFCTEIARLELASALLEKHNVPHEKIVTTQASRFLNFLLLRNKQPIKEFSTLY